jgi:CBS domain-containing protein/predicted CoA-binding protein
MLQQPTSPFLIKRRQECSLQTARRIAVVGLRADPIYKSYNRTHKLIEYGLIVFPVIPNCESVFGLGCYDRVLDIPDAIDIVQVYLDGKAQLIQAAQDAIQKRVKTFWIEDDEAPDEIRSLLLKAEICVVEYASLQKQYEQCAVHLPGPMVSNRAPVRRVRERMTRDPITITPQSSVQSALEKMRKGNFRHLPVVDDNNRLLGMFSDRDLRLVVPNPLREPKEDSTERFRATQVGDIATLNPVSILPDATLEEAADLMLHWKVEALPVIAHEDYLIGIITSSDFLKELASRGTQNKSLPLNF